MEYNRAGPGPGQSGPDCRGLTGTSCAGQQNMPLKAIDLAGMVPGQKATCRCRG
jgi:hypothetical protein